MSDRQQFNTPFAGLRVPTRHDKKTPVKVRRAPIQTLPDNDAEADALFLATMAATPSIASSDKRGGQDELFNPAIPSKKIRSKARAGSAAPGERKADGAHEADSEEKSPVPEESMLQALVPDVDENDFLRAMQDVKPLLQKGREVAPAVEVQCIPKFPDDVHMQDVLEGKVEFSLMHTGEYMEGHVVGLDVATVQKLREGQLSPEAHLDLHGLNAMQAYQALVGFFRNAWFKGLRTVLIVPGRGRNSPDGVGILRDRLQLWLTQEPFKRVVLAFCTAKPCDGGLGSVYVLLRKMRKKGKIHWERMPSDPDLY